MSSDSHGSALGFEPFDLGDDCVVGVGKLPFPVPAPAFAELWALHPETFHEIEMVGRMVKTPRWQQAYGADYVYTGNTNKGLPVPEVLEPYLEPYLVYAQLLDDRYNGLLLNWYEGRDGHYIGRHRDSTVGLVPGLPILTISLGETRPFRMRPWRAQGFHDIEAADGTVIAIPWRTNQRFTHEVPCHAHHRGRRISITLRAFTS